MSGARADGPRRLFARLAPACCPQVSRRPGFRSRATAPDPAAPSPPEPLRSATQPAVGRRDTVPAARRQRLTVTDHEAFERASDHVVDAPSRGTSIAEGGPSEEAA